MTPFLYIVKGDDTMLGIAYQFGIKLEDLLAKNPKVDPHYIGDGLTLVIPIAQPEQPVASRTELFGVWKGLWSANHNILMVFIPTMMPWVAFEEDVEYPGDDNGIEWFNVEDGIVTFGAWVGGAWVKPFSASIDCINNPQATYEVYITSYRGFAPKTLRFVLVGEDHCVDRQTFLDGQTLTWVKR
jgi:LysM repeat protein